MNPLVSLYLTISYPNCHKLGKALFSHTPMFHREIPIRSTESLPGSPARGHEDRSSGRSDVRTSTGDHPKSGPAVGHSCGLLQGKCWAHKPKKQCQIHQNTVLLDLLKFGIQQLHKICNWYQREKITHSQHI